MGFGFRVQGNPKIKFLISSGFPVWLHAVQTPKLCFQPYPLKPKTPNPQKAPNPKPPKSPKPQNPETLKDQQKKLPSPHVLLAHRDGSDSRPEFWAQVLQAIPEPSDTFSRRAGPYSCLGFTPYNLDPTKPDTPHEPYTRCFKPCPKP